MGTLLDSSLGVASLLLREQVERVDRARLQSAINWIDRVEDKTKIQANFNMSNVCYSLIYTFVLTLLFLGYVHD